MRVCWLPAPHAHVRTEVCVASLKTTRVSPVLAQMAGKVRTHKCTHRCRSKNLYLLSSVLIMSPLSSLEIVSTSVGQTCEVDINECVKSPCRNGGVCVNSMGGFQCRCNPGFTGDLCETDIDDCTPSKIHKFSKHTYITIHPQYTSTHHMHSNRR